MRVVLISTYDLGRQPFGLASPAAWFRGRGHQVDLLDLSVSPAPHELLTRADAIAFHLPMHTATRLSVPVIRRIRELNPRARLVAYGLYATLNETFLRELGVAATIGGEFEEALVRAVEDGEPASCVSLDRLAFVKPDRSGLPPAERYAHVVDASGIRASGSTEASRGCKHLCRHCPVVPVYQGLFRVVPLEVVMADVRQQVEAGVRHMTFGDPDFFNGPAHAVKIVESLHSEFPELTYDVTIKVEHLLRHAELLPLLRRTGCLWITSAAESVEDRVLERLDKGHTRGDFLQVLRLVRGAGIHLAPTFVPFTPWSTLPGYQDLMRIVRDEDLAESVAPVQLALRLLIPRSSPILNLPEIAAWLTGFDPAGLLHRWRHPDPGMDELAAAAFSLANDHARSGRPRRETFAEMWRLAFDEALPENFSLLPRSAVPYLNEPWYC